MNRIQRGFAFLVVACCAEAAAMPPTPDDAAAISAMRNSAGPWSDRVVAVRGNVVGVATDKGGQQLFQLRLGVPPRVETLWIAMAVDQPFSPGEEVLILGAATLVPTPAEMAERESRIGEIVKDPFFVLGVCYLNLTAGGSGGMRGYGSNCDEWLTARRVPDLARREAPNETGQDGAGPDPARAGAKRPFHIGPWRFGMSPDQVKSFQEFGPYEAVRSTGGLETWNAQFRGRKTNVSFVFDDAGLRYIQVGAYEGRDSDAAIRAALDIYDLFAEDFGGATVENVKIDGEAGLDRTGIQVVLRQILGTARELADKAKKDYNGSMLIRFDMLPVHQPSGSRLHCQWVYASQFDTFYILLWHDLPDAPSRSAESNIYTDKL